MHDWNECKIAEAVGLNQSNINRIKHGADPHYSHGLKIVQLAQEHVPKPRKRKVA